MSGLGTLANDGSFAGREGVCSLAGSDYAHPTLRAPEVWSTLKCLGIQDLGDDGPPLELRVCKECGTTMARELPAGFNGRVELFGSGYLSQGLFDPGMTVQGREVRAWRVTDSVARYSASARMRSIVIDFTDGTHAFCVGVEDLDLGRRVAR